jgi:hypothetical protein
MVRRLLIVALALLAALTAGCAKRVAAEELDAGGARVGAVVALASGETVRCRVLSLSRDTALVEVYYTIGGRTELRGTGDARYISVDGERVPGELVAVERDGADRTALVQRSVRLSDIRSATFHRSGSEASLGPILSTLIGPVVGALLALLI